MMALRLARWSAVLASVASVVELAACGRGAPRGTASAAPSAAESAPARGETASIVSGSPGAPDFAVLPDGRRVMGGDLTKSFAGAPNIRVTTTSLLLDGREIAKTEALASPPTLRKVDALFVELVRLREDFRMQHPSGDFPGVAIVDVDDDVPAIVVKSVYQTAAFAGYPNVSFVVKPPPPASAQPRP
ncbi:MAG TPA: hypothetical protein VL400_13655 [Polyangiaceae bacterium]|jgi:hypothetical protein|nr:hypothetical protein [Polyangiaceae bacterium]